MTAERIRRAASRERRSMIVVLAVAMAAVLAIGVPVSTRAETDSPPDSPPESAAGPGTVRTVAGGGGGGSVSYGFSGDGRPAIEAQLWRPRQIALDPAGNAYIADGLNHRIRKIDTGGIITTVTGTGDAGYSGDDGPASEAQLDNPHGVTVDSKGNVYIADSANHRIRRVDPGGVITTIAGNGTPGASPDGIPAREAQVKFPKGMAVDKADNLYFADMGNNRISRISAGDGTISTVAGQIPAGHSGDGGPALRARLNKPYAVWITSEGIMYIADSANQRVRVVGADGTISTLAGTGTAGSEGDGGPAAQAQLNEPRTVIADSAGNVYVGEEYGHRVRRIDRSGTITTVAGTGTPGFSGDGGLATEAAFHNVRGLAVDSGGNLLVADMANNRVRAIIAMASR